MFPCICIGIGSSLGLALTRRLAIFLPLLQAIIGFWGECFQVLIVFNDVPLMFSYHGVYVVLKTSSGLSLMFFLLEAGFSSFSNFFCSVCAI